MISFEALNIGDKFTIDGLSFEKKSSRTAFLLNYTIDGYSRQSLWFYFSRLDHVSPIQTTKIK
jgi:hypothetical protein